jgi:hypothetical protein
MPQAGYVIQRFSLAHGSGQVATSDVGLLAGRVLRWHRVPMTRDRRHMRDGGKLAFKADPLWRKSISLLIC